MRGLSVLLAAGAFALLWTASASAQPVLKATGTVARELPEPTVTLRPAPGLEDLAQRVAAVLELRTGHAVEVGDHPPPGLEEAVPAGHVALAFTGEGSIRVVLGTTGGGSFQATVEVDGASSPDARAIALAVEALRDEAVDAAGEAERAQSQAAAVPAPPQPTPVARAAVDLPPPQPAGDRLFSNVDPLVFVRAYGGASTSSSAPMTGLGLGAGLCVLKQCLVIAADFPLGVAEGSADDVRYQYMTFLSGFYSRPFSFGAFTPGAQIGFLTRVGHFRRDMGLDDKSLETDLGARGSLELAWEVLGDMDVMAEGGVDATLDRHEVYVGDVMATRGDRWSPWLQTAVRYRP